MLVQRIISSPLQQPSLRREHLWPDLSSVVLRGSSFRAALPSISHPLTSCPALTPCRAHPAHTVLCNQKQEVKEAGALTSGSPVPAYVEVLLALRTALDNEDIQGVIEAYGVLRTSFKLGADDAAALAQAVHTASRGRGEGEKKKRGAPELAPTPSHTAHLHLLAFFKEAEQFDKGNNFWSWLVRQSDDYVDPSVYGAAIELCAAMGMSAETTEDMYMQALKRFPGSFNEYHLAPDAIVADRSLATNIKGIPMTLLQGILTARLLRGDTRDAYLALDTALRLYPTQAPPRFITLFITERPLPESYKVFMMACRSGIVVGHDGLKMLLTRLRTAASSSPVENATLLRAILTSTYAYAAAGGTLSSSPLTEVVTGLSRVLQDPAFATCSPEEAKEAADKLLTTVQQTFEIWNLHGSQPGIGAFNSIIANIAGKGKRMDVISTSLDNIETLGLEPTAVTRRSILTAAGHLQDRSLIKNAWLDLVDLRERAGTPVEPGDWNMLVKAAKKAGCLDLVKQQMAELDHALTSTVRKRISGQLEENEGDTNEKAAEKTKADSAQLVGFINLLHTDVHLMNEELRARPVRDFFLNPLPLSLGVSVDSMPEAVEEELRRVYDELTTDPQAREAPASISSTNTAPSTDTATSILSDVPGSTSGPSVRSDQDSPDDDNDPVKQSPEHEHPPPPPPPAISSTGFPSTNCATGTGKPSMNS
ncbi:hypothetical protein H2203_005576 [Taxawa tesnikishii (nom. ined.)]|nr:hypothetical protein H2203_005576 [Dothideales sp. JES 119]